ncbi:MULTISPECIES: CRISPR-associated protein Csx19 [unclassified Desertifilum]|uniref:type III-D CRISPR-associated protein Csx19 n=1 Tax=unclassified Desertifilum TaxID=2621682 RepID=UPI001F54F72E|nr:MULTISPECIES: CRISPR-associated protein Csx19 [unclassified Desertifilum]MDA0211211.1 CRISPR-associated protein Csx19 [Cyanobacteria bacterium FC1]
MKEELCMRLPVGVLNHDQDLFEWLDAHAQTYHLKYLLAHADDGIIWGHFRQENLNISNCVLPQSPLLRLATLQQCRVFSQVGEVMLWKFSGEWKARFISDLKINPIIENQILWGTHGYKREHKGFTILKDGSQGLKHAVPITDIEVDKAEKLVQPVRLTVYHYIDYGDNGIARIHLSRLVDLTTNQN